MYNEVFLIAFAKKVKGAYPAFEADVFVTSALGPGWNELELKGRMHRITDCLGAALPEDYEQAIAILNAIADDCRGFPYLIFPDFVERFGIGFWDVSVKALERYTPMSSAEFAVRPFLMK